MHLKEFLGYGVASTTALLTDTGILFYLVRYCHVGRVKAACLSFTVGAVVAYLLSVRLAFSTHRFRSRRIEFLIFFLLGIFGLLVNAAVVAVGSRLDIELLPTKAAAASITFFCNFLLRRQILFVIPQARTYNAHA